MVGRICWICCWRAWTQRRAEPRLVFVGDLIDRGPHSAGVLRRLLNLCQAEPDRITCLMGNHERMMLDFLDAPAARARCWLLSRDS